MIDFPTIKQTLEDQVRSMLPPPADTHNFEPRWVQSDTGNIQSNRNTGWKVFLRLQSIEDVATMRRYAESQITPGQLTESIASQRVMIVELKAEADYFDNGEKWAFRVVERVKTGLNFRSVRDAFLDVNMAYVGGNATIDASFPHEDRTVNAALCELVFNIADCFTVEDVNWIETVFLSSEIKNEAGALINENFTDKEITRQ